MGVQDKNFFYLDPHTVQTAAPDEAALSSSFPDEDETEKYHCDNIKLMQASNIDPSLAIGFYCRTVKDFIDLRGRIGKKGLSAPEYPDFSLGQLSRLSPVFVSVQDTRPVYDTVYCDDEEEDEGLETASEGRGEGGGGEEEFVLL